MLTRSGSGRLKEGAVLSAKGNQLSEEEWVQFLVDWKAELTAKGSSKPPDWLSHQWRRLLRSYSRRFNSIVQTASDFELGPSDRPQPFAPWAMDNISGTLLDQLLEAEFSGHHNHNMSIKANGKKKKKLSRKDRKRLRFQKKRLNLVRETAHALGLSVWTIYLFLGEHFAASQSSMAILHDLCHSKLNIKTPAGDQTRQDFPLQYWKRKYLEEVIYPKILGAAVKRRGTVNTTPIACARTATNNSEEKRGALLPFPGFQGSEGATASSG